MPDNDQPDTEAAPTTEASAETTELPPASHAPEQVYAWSVDDTAELDSPRRGRLLSAGLVSLVVVIAGALIFFAATLFGFGQSKPVEPSAKPSTIAAPQPPPPPPVTVTAAPPPPAVTVTAAPPPPALPPAPAPVATATAGPRDDYNAMMFCQLVKRDPTDQGFLAAIDEMSARHVSAEDIGSGIGLATSRDCPEYMPLLRKNANRHWITYGWFAGEN